MDVDQYQQWLVENAQIVEKMWTCKSSIVCDGTRSDFIVRSELRAILV